MNQTENQFNQQLCDFLDASPTPFHAVSSMVALLAEAGFTELSDDTNWSLKPVVNTMWCAMVLLLLPLLQAQKQYPKRV